MVIMITYFNKPIDFLYETIIKIKPLIVFYLSWIFIHYISSQLYIYYCVPANFFGIFLSPILSMTPYCTAFRWVIYEAGNIFYGMWIALGTWIAANLLIYK